MMRQVRDLGGIPQETTLRSMKQSAETFLRLLPAIETLNGEVRSMPPGPAKTAMREGLSQYVDQVMTTVTASMRRSGVQSVSLLPPPDEAA